MVIPCLPERIQSAVERLPEERKRALEELRFRRGYPVTLMLAEREIQLRDHGGAILVTDKLLQEIYNRATEYSPYAMKSEEMGLFYSLAGGFRMGICGEAILREGEFRGLLHISSLVIRVAKQHIGIAEPVSRVLLNQRLLPSCLILSPPGCGKTSFLRDLVRCVSQKGVRVAVVDERRELSAMREGKTVLDLGPATDVLCGLNKRQAIELLLRVMNPQVIAVDELGAGETEAILDAAASGVSVFATVHGGSVQELKMKRQFVPLLSSGLFQYCVIIGRDHHYTLERLDEYAEGVWWGNGGLGSHDSGLVCRTGASTKRIPAQANWTGSGADGQ